MLRRRRLALLAVVVMGGSAVLAVGPATAQSPASAAEPTPTVEVWSADGKTRLDGITSELLGAQQAVTVKWTGFTPNSRVVLSQCLTPGRAWYQHGNLMNSTTWDPYRYCAHQLRKAVTTNADGSGSATFTVKQGEMALSRIGLQGSGSALDSLVFSCAAGSACTVIASECEWSQPLDWQIPPNFPIMLHPRAVTPEGIKDPARAAASQPLNFAMGSDGKPINTVVPALPLPDFPEDKPPPVPPPITGELVGASIYGTGSANVGTVFDAWLAGVRGTSKAADVGFSRTTSEQGGGVLKSGFQSKFDRGGDFAVTGLDYDKETVGGDVAYAPISLTALAVANSVEIAGQPLRDARMSPRAFGVMLGIAGVPQGNNTQNWGGLPAPGQQPILPLDNHGCELPPKSVVPVFRLGKSAQNQVLSGWLAANVPSFEPTEGGLELQGSAGGGTRGVQSGSETAQQLATQFGSLTSKNSEGVPLPEAEQNRAGRGSLGYLDITEVDAFAARGFTLGVSPLLNAAGKYVAPTKDSILAAFATMKKNDDGIYTPVFDAKNAEAAYPLPMIHYLAVPKRGADGKNPLPQDKRKALAAFIRYVASDAAQAKVEQLGGAPLPQTLRDQSLQVAAMLDLNDATPPPAGNGGENGNGGGNGGGGNGGGGNGNKTTDEGTPGAPDNNAKLLDGGAKPAPTATVRITHTPSPRATTKSSGTGKSGGSGSGGSSNQQPIENRSGTNTGGATTPPPTTDTGTGGTGQPVPDGGAQQPGAQTTTTPSAQPLANEGTVRGGTIPAASWAARTSLLLILGLIALSVGGTWRGYVLWRIRANAATAAGTGGPKPPTGTTDSGAAPSTTPGSGA
ncbi:hypothetical protein [Sphaerisporangium sp. NPDC051011]|uniref:hypothetical protein n=1 Tax=Sphaerisporangium sp. NPDC051011 TaxID=3155792 RepID=UPI0033CB7B0E